MRLHINLASQPYEAARLFRQRIGALVLALAIIGAALIGYIVYQRIQSRDINRQLAEVRQQIDGLGREEAQARAILNKPANRAVADQSEFLNDLFARKALSWTRVFTEMERIMPPNLHVVSIKPEYNKTGELTLRMVVATDSRDRAVELVRQIEKSPHFRQPQVVAENVLANTSDQSAGPGNIQFDVAAIYIPNAQDSEAPADSEKDNGKDSNQPPKPVPAKAAASPSPAAAQPPDAGTAQAQNRPRRERDH